MICDCWLQFSLPYFGFFEEDIASFWEARLVMRWRSQAFMTPMHELIFYMHFE